jgi:hypothetical protein
MSSICVCAHAYASCITYMHRCRHGKRLFMNGHACIRFQRQYRIHTCTCIHTWGTNVRCIAYTHTHIYTYMRGHKHFAHEHTSTHAKPNIIPWLWICVKNNVWRLQISMKNHVYVCVYIYNIKNWWIRGDPNPQQHPNDTSWDTCEYTCTYVINSWAWAHLHTL